MSDAEICKPSPYDIQNYCVLFVDLLGYRKRFKDDGLIPEFRTDEEKAEFQKKVHERVHLIDDLRKTADKLVLEATACPSNGMNSLPADQRAEIERLWKTDVRKQFFSDSLVYYLPLGQNPDVPLPVLAVQVLIICSGLLSLLALGRNIAIRGAIDVAWGVELNPGELLGAAPVKAYEFEKTAAEYPRVIVSPRTVEFLKNPCPESEVSKDMACQTFEDLVCRDVDGFHFVDYLNEHFAKMVVRKSERTCMYSGALDFVRAELDRHTKNEDWKLAGRYSRLLFYLEDRRKNWIKE
jgi:hypothetical protein